MLALALALALTLALAQLLAGRHDSPLPGARHALAPHRTLQSLPLSAQGQISGAIAADQPAYRIGSSAGGLKAANPAQKLSTSFSRAGVSVSSGATQLTLRLQAFGYGASLQSLPAVSPSAKANRVTYAHPGIEEWYANGPLGVEQGFTLAHAPAHATRQLTLALTLSGNARTALRGGTLTFTHPGGPTLRYGGLFASDAHGRAPRSVMRLEGNWLRLVIDTRHARYPLRIDPFIQQGSVYAQSGGKLTGGSGAGQFGATVALSSDGSTALIGAPYGNPFGNKIGAAYVFVRSGSGWSEQAKLTGAGEVAGGRFGEIVALSSDGNTALIGGPGDNSNVGAAWVFTRSGSTWTQQGSKLTGSGGVGEGYFGEGVALSSDGNTALIGGSSDNSGLGSAWVFTRSGSTWTQQGAKLTGSGEVGGARFGATVALSSNGNTAMIGGPNDNGEVGAAWVFTRSGSTWTQQGSKLTGSGETGTGAFGFRVSLSADGNTALIGGPFDNGGKIGAAWVFTRAGSTWSQQAKLTGSGQSGPEAAFGAGVSLSSDGNTALIGGPWDNFRQGAAWVFTRSGSSWIQQGSKLTGAGGQGSSTFGAEVAIAADGNTALVGAPYDNSQAGAAWVFASKLTGGGESGKGEFGFSVALSSDGNTALVGGPFDNSSAGAAWVFTRSGSTWTQQGSKLTGSGGIGIGGFGESVALSADGSTALIGGSDDNNLVGAAWVFTRSGSTWTQQGGKLTGSGESGSGAFGWSVALSSDGNTALVGGWRDGNYVGAAWVFTRSGSAWTQQGSKLTGSGEVGEGYLGWSVALSSDGNTALIGGPGDNSNVGAAWVFTRSGSTWTQQGAKLTGAGASGEAEFGSSAALSADGNTALIGGPRDGFFFGAAWVFTRSGSTWSQQGAKLTGSGEGGSGKFGESVALSSDGNTALIGAPRDSNDVGAAWVFTRSGSTWTQQGSKLTGSGESGGGWFGYSVAVSGDGGTGLMGGFRDTTDTGAAWVFTNAPAVTKVKPTSGPVGGGTSVTITGTGFTGASAVHFGSLNAASFTVNSATSITAVSPAAAAATVDVRVTTATGNSPVSSKDRFKFTPTITGVSPNGGSTSGGTSVTVTGTGFALGSTATTIKFGTVKGTSVNCTSSTICAVTSPAHSAATVDVSATVNKGKSPKATADHFTYS